MAKLFPDAYSLIEKSVYRINPKVDNPNFSTIVTQKVDLLSRSFFEACRSNIEHRHSKIFLTMREMIFLIFLREFNDFPSSTTKEAILSTYKNIIIIAYKTCMGFLESSVFPRIEPYFNILFNDYGALLQFVDHYEHQYPNIRKLIIEHSQNRFLVVYKLLKLSQELDLPKTISNVILDFLKQQRYPKQYLQLPSFGFDNSYSGGEAYIFQDHYFNYVVISAALLSDTSPDTMIPETNSLSNKENYLEQLNSSLQVLTFETIRKITYRDINTFEIWKNELLKNIKNKLDSIPAEKRRELSKVPVSIKKEEVLKNSILNKLNSWPIDNLTADSDQSFKTVNFEFDFPKLLLIENEESIIDLATSNLVKIASDDFLRKIIEDYPPNKSIETSSLSELKGKKQIVFINRSEYITYRRAISKDYNLNPESGFFDDVLVRENNEINIKVLDFSNSGALLWDVDIAKFPISFSDNFLSMDRTQENGESVLYKLTLTYQYRPITDSYKLKISST
ncbi:hypothetical protein QMM87_15675 [Leptospira santarosai]|uniref:hypothetical protein n=1 Tax=Leptospira santarosai TaxID=28183 RepID=UPI0024AFEC68|nr:hypothetical protein [Leptospira santarosai]MDI7230089.1 hypothetical protein [Leptospira santarosai]